MDKAEEEGEWRRGERWMLLCSPGPQDLRGLDNPYASSNWSNHPPPPSPNVFHPESPASSQRGLLSLAPPPQRNNRPIFSPSFFYLCLIDSQTMCHNMREARRIAIHMTPTCHLPLNLERTVFFSAMWRRYAQMGPKRCRRYQSQRFTNAPRS